MVNHHVLSKLAILGMIFRHNHFFSRRGTLLPSGAEGYAFGVWASNGSDLAKNWIEPCDAIWTDLAMIIYDTPYNCD